MIWLDWGERAFLTLLYVVFALAAVGSGEAMNLVLVVTEGLAVAFVLTRRRATAMSTQPGAWAAAAAATLLPLLLRPGGDPIADWLAMPLGLAGLVIVTSAKLSLNRRLGMAPANRGIQSGWSYAIVRHPMYLGYFLAQAGFLLHNPTAWNGAIVAVGWVLQLVRIRQEEAFLSADPLYRAYAVRVRFRLFPGIF